MTIVEFLEARIAEDRSRALITRRSQERQPEYPLVNPERMLAECQAKRAIIALHHEHWAVTVDTDGDDRYYLECVADGDDFPCPTLRHLTAVYADHPDYLEEWRP